MRQKFLGVRVCGGGLSPHGGPETDREEWMEDPDITIKDVLTVTYFLQLGSVS
jgi:hypothetical protein